MTLQQEISEFQKYIDAVGAGVKLGMGIPAIDILDHLLELEQLHQTLDELEGALRDIYLRVKSVGVE